VPEIGEPMATDAAMGLLYTFCSKMQDVVDIDRLVQKHHL